MTPPSLAAAFLNLPGPLPAELLDALWDQARTEAYRGASPLLADLLKRESEASIRTMLSRTSAQADPYTWDRLMIALVRHTPAGPELDQLFTEATEQWLACDSHKGALHDLQMMLWATLSPVQRAYARTSPNLLTPATLLRLVPHTERVELVQHIHAHLPDWEVAGPLRAFVVDVVSTVLRALRGKNIAWGPELFAGARTPETLSGSWFFSEGRTTAEELTQLFTWWALPLLDSGTLSEFDEEALIRRVVHRVAALPAHSLEAIVNHPNASATLKAAAATGLAAPQPTLTLRDAMTPISTGSPAARELLEALIAARVPLGPALELLQGLDEDMPIVDAANLAQTVLV